MKFVLTRTTGDELTDEDKAKIPARFVQVGEESDFPVYEIETLEDLQEFCRSLQTWVHFEMFGNETSDGSITIPDRWGY